MLLCLEPSDQIKERFFCQFVFALQTKDKHVANANETLVYLHCPETDCVTDKRLILVDYNYMMENCASIVSIVYLFLFQRRDKGENEKRW